MRPDWSPPPLHGPRARRLDARVGGTMTILGSLTAVPFAHQSPFPAVLYGFAGLCALSGVLMVVLSARVRPGVLTVANVVGAVGITSVAAHAPDGATFASGPILYVIAVLQVGLLRSRREAWLQLGWALACYTAGLTVVGVPAGAAALTVLPVLLALVVLNVAVTWLRARVEVLVGEVDRLIRELRRQADHDPLTGLLNRQGMVRRAARDDVLTEGTILLLDVDHFKHINDVGGHLAGDRLLARLGAELAAIPVRPEMAVRVGGEEFLLILRGTDPAAARQRAERLRRHLGATLSGPGAALTVSIGLACGPFGPAFTGLYREADDALYRAKDRGRDRVELGGDTGATTPAGVAQAAGVGSS